jgi:predicted type IV restriction endonuclease
MKPILENITSGLRRGNYKNEEHVRVAIVLRLLQALGWDIWNTTEVNTEFSPVRDEDSSRLDVAIFMPPQHLRPALFIEVKAVGKLLAQIEFAEKQLRDYNRNNQAEISVLTDGRLWRFYLAGAAGEFRQKCFEDIDFLDPNSTLDDSVEILRLFLSRESLSSGQAVEQARIFLRRTDDQRIMFDLLPLALRDAELDPTVSAVECFVRRCKEHAVVCPHDDAKKFILDNRSPAKKQTVFITAEPPQPATHLESSKADAPPSANQAQTLSLVGKNGTIATGQALPTGSFLVFSGAIAVSASEGFTRHNYYSLYRKLIEDGVLAPLNNGTTYRLTKNFEFKSPSAAAAVLLGRPANGPKEWKPKK